MASSRCPFLATLFLPSHPCTVLRRKLENRSAQILRKEKEALLRETLSARLAENWFLTLHKGKSFWQFLDPVRRHFPV